MQHIEILRKHGLFDAKVPRYTSYPPANHFENGVGGARQVEWIEAIPEGADVSLYIHIPFCKRLCWFCACRTQGTQTMRPVDAYADILISEINAVRAKLSPSVRVARLHLGGGTPTILPLETMKRLLNAVFKAFERSDRFEFSVEIDPTEASEALLRVLVEFGLNRASIGVQDFAPRVQKAIGRPQTLEQTLRVVNFLRGNGVESLNLDLLYGLPHQTSESFCETMLHVSKMRPDRLAIYGYAHVPWVSKRQVMIKAEDLPDNQARYELSELAKATFLACGYQAIGIDHFALPSDSLAKAARQGGLRRNFQGYTDDAFATLIGFGASAISRFAQGYVQNAPATSSYQERIAQTGFAGAKGYKMSTHDMLVARMVEDLMCNFALSGSELCDDFPNQTAFIRRTLISLRSRFSDIFVGGENELELCQFAHPLARIVAKEIDGFASVGAAHSAAV